MKWIRVNVSKKVSKGEDLGVGKMRKNQGRGPKVEKWTGIIYREVKKWKEKEDQEAEKCHGINVSWKRREGEDLGAEKRRKSKGRGPGVGKWSEDGDQEAERTGDNKWKREGGQTVGKWRQEGGQKVRKWLKEGGLEVRKGWIKQKKAFLKELDMILLHLPLLLLLLFLLKRDKTPEEAERKKSTKNQDRIRPRLPKKTGHKRKKWEEERHREMLPGHVTHQLRMRDKTKSEI